jgi:hypothetical protein
MLSAVLRSRDAALPRAHGFPRASARLWALLLLLVALLLPRVVTAARPVIAPGREQEILALFEPHALGDELAPGWTLHSFSIDSATIHVWLVGPDEVHAHVTLDHPDYGPPRAQQLQGFALGIVAQPWGSEAAVAELIASIERNDHGEFWQREVIYAEEPRTYPFGATGVVLREWATDGLVLLALFTVVLLVLVLHTLRGTAPWMKWALLAIVLGGVLARLTLSPKVALEAWPFSRFLISGRLIFNGPGLAALHPEPVWATDAITTSTLALAMLAPPAVFVHARYLLDDHRAALIAAGIIAVLPMHLRFSYTDVAYIPSITLSAMLFTLTYVATREPSKVLGWFAAVSIGFPLVLVFLLRPLNIMHVGLLMTVPWVNQGIYTEKLAPNWPRVVVAFTIMTLVTVFGGIPWLLEDFGQQVREGLSITTLTSAVGVLFSPRMNALLNFEFTPPGLTVLAVLGSVDLWRRGKRRLFSFLVLWLLGGLVAHAYVVPYSEYMQARYHLHLIVPFLMLAACGLEVALRWLAANRHNKSWLAGRRYPAVIALLIGYVCASPLLHKHFIRNTEFNDAREWLFVHSLREQIPAGCEVVEFVGRDAGSRFQRVGTYVEDGVLGSRWKIHEIPAVEPGEPELSEEIRALLFEPPECLYWYEGLPCLGQKQIEEHKAGACDAIEGFVTLEEVASTSFESRIYDENLGVGLGDLEHIELKLFRAHARARE